MLKQAAEIQPVWYFYSLQNLNPFDVSAIISFWHGQRKASQKHLVKVFFPKTDPRTSVKTLNLSSPP